MTGRAVVPGGWFTKLDKHYISGLVHVGRYLQETHDPPPQKPKEAPDHQHLCDKTSMWDQTVSTAWISSGAAELRGAWAYSGRRSVCRCRV